MKIAVTGANGFLGARVKKMLKLDGHEVMDIDYPMDITEFQPLREAILAFGPHCVVHCAAVGDIWRCAEDHSLADRVNIQGTKNIASICADLNASLVSVSSDQVYDYQSMEPLNEYTQPRPLNYYGYTKVEAEKIVQSMVTRHFIVRLAWQYGYEEQGMPKSRDGLAEQIAEAYKTKKKILYTKGAYQNINYIYDTMDVFLAMVYEKVPFGIYNVCSPNTLDDREMKKYILKKLNASRDEIDELLVEDPGAKPFDLRAEPYNLTLAGYKMPTFEEGVNRCFKEMMKK